MKNAILILTLFFSIGSYACMCDEILTIENALKHSEKVFTGKIISVEPYDSKVYENGDEIIEEYSNVKVKIEITNSFKGDLKNIIEIVTGTGAGDCGYDFIVEEEYLIFAYDNGIYTDKNDGIMETNKCDGNGKVSNRKEWITYLKKTK